MARTEWHGLRFALAPRCRSRTARSTRHRRLLGAGRAKQRPGPLGFGGGAVACGFERCLTALLGRLGTSRLGAVHADKLVCIHLNLLAVRRDPKCAWPSRRRRSGAISASSAPAAVARGAHLHRHPALDRNASRRPLCGDGADRGAGQRDHRVLPASSGGLSAMAPPCDRLTSLWRHKLRFVVTIAAVGPGGRR